MSSIDRRPLLDDSSDNKPRSRYFSIAAIVFVALLIIVSIILVIVIAVPGNKGDADEAENTSGNLVCPAKDFPLQYNGFYRTPSPNTFSQATGPTIVISNATVWTGVEGSTFVSGLDIVVINGKIAQIGPNLVHTVTNATIYEVKGRFVTPGLVDSHSHLGVYAYPEDSFGTQDGNEMTGPALPQVRAIDGLNPNDPAIPLIRSGGVTSSLILPGSANAQGGQAAYVKLRGNTISEMLIKDAPRAMKMACGENPKRVYGSRNKTPGSRMGVGWIFRSQFYKAAQLKQLQDQWDCLNSQGQATTPRPNDITLEPLVALLNGDVYLHVHCYKVEDLEMMVRTSHEFGFRIASFHHALEAWKVPDLMRENNITICTFADHWGFKMEGYDASVNGPKILADSGAKVALKSDHPVIFARYLLLEAAKSHFYGLDEWQALASVTIVPAKGVGIGHRVGSLEVGKDGDIVIWDRHPLQLGAKPDKVFIEGILIDDFDLPIAQSQANQQASLTYTGSTACKNTDSSSYVLQGVTIYTMNDDNSILNNSKIVVENGVITCLGNSCQNPPASDIYTLNGGIVIPGAISVGQPVGLLEVESESGTQDGVAGVSNAHDIRAIDGIRFSNFYNRHMRATWAGGVTTVVAGPLGTNLISGVSVAFNTHGITVDDAIVSEASSLDIHIGNDAKNGQYTSSISGQFAQLRSLFKASINTGNAIEQALQGNLTIIAYVNQADEIASLIRLKKELGLPKVVIVGGAESHLVANKIAENDITVILSRSAPNTFETWAAVPNTASLLHKAGVTVGVTQYDVGNVRNIRWEAGLHVSEGLPYYDGIASITRVPAKALGLQGVGEITENSPANFVAFSADPLSFNGKIQLVALKSFVECQPKQF